MRGPGTLLALAVMLRLAAVSQAALVVNPPRPITHRLSVQLVQTALDGGSPVATAFGNASQRAAIESYVDTIWQQAGVDIDFLPGLVPFNNTFAYQGTSDPRPTGDLNRIIDRAEDAGGILHPDPAVTNFFFVNVVPGWGPKSESWVNGVGNIGRNGIAFFTGDSALTTTVGLERIAHWAAHEIAHNLGLKHIDNATFNLLNDTRQTQQLDAVQIAAIFQTQFRDDSVAYIPTGGTGFLRSLPPLLPGDYNRDGRVDALDYAVWRNAASTGLYVPLADGDGSGIIDVGDFDVWKDGYGLGMSIVGNDAGDIGGGSIATPEPAAYFSAALGTALFLVSVRRR